MNEEPRSIWKRPWEGRRKVFGWLLLLNVVTFVILLAFTLISGLVPASAAVLTSLVIAITVSAAMVIAILFGRWVICWRNFKKFLFGVACFATLIALLFAVENWRGKRAWEKHRNELLAKGEKLSIAELAPPPIPDDQNFAMTRLLKPVMDFTQSSSGTVWHDTNGSAWLQAIAAELRMDSSDGKIKLGSVEEGTLADLASWQDFYLGNTNYPQPVASGVPAEDVLIALSKFDQEIRELIQAAKNRPLARFPIAYEYEPPFQILLPNLAHVKGLTRLIHVRVTAMVEMGQVDRAFDELKLGFRFSDSISEEPIVISHLVRAATMNINLQAVREGLARHVWNADQLVELQTRLEAIDLLAEYQNAMRGDRAMYVGSVDFMRRQGLRFDGVVWSGEGWSEVEWLVLFPRGWFYQNMVAISKLYEDLFFPAVDEQTHRIVSSIVENLDQTIKERRAVFHPYSYFTLMLYPNLHDAPIKSARTQFFVDAAQLACALERYRLANGRLPDNLSALTPQFINSIPTDVIDGEPLRYRKTGDDSYVIYSVGWNQTDEGGEVGWTNDKETSVNIRKGDWVWFQ